jgi:hypothetical protein
VEKRRRRPVMACETVEGRGTCHDAESAGATGAPGVEVPDDDDVGVCSSKVLADIV